MLLHLGSGIVAELILRRSVVWQDGERRVGLVMPGKRKSVEPMAAVTAPDRTAAQHQSLLHFVGPWSDEKVLAKVGEMVPSITDRSRRGSSTTQVFPRRGHTRWA
jgi:SRSO17 transposase